MAADLIPNPDRRLLDGTLESGVQNHCCKRAGGYILPSLGRPKRKYWLRSFICGVRTGFLRTSERGIKVYEDANTKD